MSEKKIIGKQSIINYVDLYETRAVRQYAGGSYGKKGARVGGGVSESKQEWKNIGRGNLALSKDEIVFIGGGQQRTIDRKKINGIICHNKEALIEISVSNRQKTMRFKLPGRSVTDAEKLCEAIKNGNSSVNITVLDKEPNGCYIATYVYGDYNNSNVLILRDYRDNVLLKNKIGINFVKIYYKISPLLIKYLGKNILFKKSCKKLLDLFIKINDIVF